MCIVNDCLFSFITTYLCCDCLKNSHQSKITSLPVTSPINPNFPNEGVTNKSAKVTNPNSNNSLNNLKLRNENSLNNLKLRNENLLSKRFPKRKIPSDDLKFKNNEIPSEKYKNVNFAKNNFRIFRHEETKEGNNKIGNNKIENNKIENNKIGNNKIENNKIENNKIEEITEKDNKVEIEENKVEENKIEEITEKDNKVEVEEDKVEDKEEVEENK